MNRKLKTFLLSKFPLLEAFRNRVKYPALAGKSPARVFTEIFRENIWGDKESLSGPGSNLAQTAAVRRALPLLIRELQCKSLLDVPCGDFFWMKLVEMDIDYIGGDIVDELVSVNQEKYASARRRFMYLDILKDELPPVDVVLCRDCLVHFSYQHTVRALRNIKRSGSTYLLTTTFVDRDINEYIPTGEWRPINLQLSPYNFPVPITLIDEKCPDVHYRDKHLGLWKTIDIPVH